MNYSRAILCFLVLLCFCKAQSQGRTQWNINDNWKFYPNGISDAEFEKYDDTKWQKVSLPHTWNASDPFDDDKTYRRGISWYRKTVNINQKFKDKNVFLYFEGAGQVADVYVNGSFAGRHKGGYTAFAFNITHFLKWAKSGSDNVIAVQVNNAHDPFIAPLSIGYASYGGIYRDAWIIATDKLHFADVNNNSGGVYISTPAVTDDHATIAIKTTIQNDDDKERTFQFVNKITDRNGKEIASLIRNLSIAAGAQATESITSDAVNNIHLWSPDDPYLYTVKSQVVADGVVMDEVTNTLGFRWFSFNPDNGFSLNGKKMVLHGTNRHQDMEGKGDALSSEDHERDMKMIKDMGANFVRLAHYPQAPQVLQLADKLGLLIWEETPVLNFITQSEEFVTNAEKAVREMITQGYNHPSVIMWGFSNEILLYSKEGVRIQTHADTAYLSLVRKYLVRLDSTVRAEDTTRASTMAMHGSNDYYKFKLDIIPRVSSYNIYNGWYSGKLEDFGKDVDMYHNRQPKQALFISEYGAEGEVKLASENPVRMDYTTQYQRLYHESYLRQITQRPFLAGTAVWSEFDFSQPNIGGPTPHRNQKGLVSWNRKPKDVYYFYKANWNPAPSVYIASRDWLNRAGEQDALSTIDVYSNLSEITLFVNGQRQKEQKTNDIKKCSWQVRLVNGANVVMASGKINGKVYNDQVVINYKACNRNLSSAPFQNLSINTGSNAQYCEPSGNIWIEDRPYKKGSFGYVNGTPAMFSRNEVIKGTNDVPMYYTYLDSLHGYRLDVKDGEYKVTLCFAESKYTDAGQRVFDVSINNENVINDLDLAASAGFAQAVTKTFIVKAKDNQGINISFNTKKGSAVLSGIQVTQ